MHLVTPPSRRHRLTLIALVVCIVAVVAAMSTVIVGASLASTPTLSAPHGAQDPSWSGPTADDGLIAEGATASLADDGVTAIARLDPALRDAMRRAEADAALEGIRFDVTSGWRSDAYQRWLLDEAVELYASEEIARQYVAAPDRSSHVTGRAVDIASLDAQLWLIEHGAAYGLCQTYANERWHFELATAPGGVCPDMKTDAAS
ncbi:MAG: M15 family metallopeptidase [Microbacterium sp.]